MQRAVRKELDAYRRGGKHIKDFLKGYLVLRSRAQDVGLETPQNEGMMLLEAAELPDGERLQILQGIKAQSPTLELTEGVTF